MIGRWIGRWIGKFISLLRLIFLVRGAHPPVYESIPKPSHGIVHRNDFTAANLG